MVKFRENSAKPKQQQNAKAIIPGLKHRFNGAVDSVVALNDAGTRAFVIPPAVPFPS